MVLPSYTAQFQPSRGKVWYLQDILTLKMDLKKQRFGRVQTYGRHGKNEFVSLVWQGLQKTPKRHVMNYETIEKKINLFSVCENSPLGVNTLINAGNKK